MFKKIILYLVAVGLITIFIAMAANALYFRGRGTVENFHDCTELNGPECLGAYKVEDRLYGAVAVPEVDNLNDCQLLNNFWYVDEEGYGTCYQPTCAMTGTVVCEEGDDCGLLEFTEVGIDQDSFSSTAYFTNQGTATGIGYLDRDLGIEACGDFGVYSDYKPNALIGFTTYYKESGTNLVAFYKFIDVCPDYQPDPDLPYKRDKYTCSPVWTWDGSAETPPLPCCGGDSTKLEVIVTGSGTVTSDDKKIECVEGGENCIAEYGKIAPYDTCPEVTLTAKANEYYTFKEWGEGCTKTDGDKCITTPTAKVEAFFELGDDYIRVVVIGNSADDAKVWIKDPQKADFAYPLPPSDYCYNDCIIDTSDDAYNNTDTIVLKRAGGDWLTWDGVNTCTGDNNSLTTCIIPIDGSEGREVIAIWQ